MKSALPHDTVRLGRRRGRRRRAAATGRRVHRCAVAGRTRRRHAARSGPGRGSNTGPCTSSRRTRPESRPPANSAPPTAKATTVVSASVAYDGDAARHLAEPLALRPLGVGHRVAATAVVRVTGQRVGVGDEPLLAGVDVEHPQRVDRVAPTGAAQEHDTLAVGAHREVAGLAERESLCARVLAGEGVAHRAILTVGRSALAPGSTWSLTVRR